MKPDNNEIDECRLPIRIDVDINNNAAMLDELCKQNGRFDKMEVFAFPAKMTRLFGR
jgi:hypothetical protein